MTAVPAASAALQLEFAGEWFTVDPERPFDIGRDADLDLDDNQYLHRRFLQIVRNDGLWWLCNVGTRLSATVTDGSGGFQAWLSPGAKLPIVFGATTVVFTAGPTTYEMTVHTPAPPFADLGPLTGPSGDTTIGPVALTAAQRLLVLALCEPMLRRDGSGTSEIPSSAKAAERLGWPLTKFNRKLDNVCDKLDRVGVSGLRGGVGALATNRRARLVEYAVSSHLVTRIDLPLLDAEHAANEAAAAEGSAAGDAAGTD